MANNIFQRQVTPAKPNVLEGERIFVYVPQATTDVAGIASYNSDDFVVTNAGKVKIKWPYAHNGVFGLVKVEDDSAGYLKFTDDENHYLEVDSEKIKVEIVDAAITVHNESEEAHPYIQEKIQLVKEEVIAAIAVHNESEEAHLYIQEKIQLAKEEVIAAIAVHNESEEAHTNLFNNKVDKYKKGTGILPPSTTINNEGNKLELRYSGSLAPRYINLDSVGIDIHTESSSIATAPTFTKIKCIPNIIEMSASSPAGFGSSSVTNTLKLTSTTFTLNERKIALEDYVDSKIAEITAVHIRNKEPNLVINATMNTVQEIATQYIVDNYGRQPEMNDGLFITFTDKRNDVIKYAYFNNSWINVGLNDIDITNYVDLNTTQTITGNKDFRGVVTKNGLEVATETYVDEHIASEIEQLNFATVDDITAAIGNVSSLLGDTSDLEV